MLLLMMTSARLDDAHPAMARMLMQGRVAEGLRLGHMRLEHANAFDARQRSAAAQLAGRAMLALGDEADAEEQFQKSRKVYEATSRSAVRWLSCLDQGSLMLSLNRPGRAAEAFNMVADDAHAPVALRIEAMAGLSLALEAAGESVGAARSLQEGRRLAAAEGMLLAGSLLEAIDLEVTVQRHLRGWGDDGDDTATLAFGLQAGMSALASVPMAVQRLGLLHTLVNDSVPAAATLAGVNDALRWLRERRLAGFEMKARIDSALAFTLRAEARSAAEVLGSLAYDEQQVHRHRYALELTCCLSQLHALQGRLGEALRLHKHYTKRALCCLRTELSQLPFSRCLERSDIAGENGATKLRLPLRYRKAYQFIQEHLHDADLSIRQVAAYVKVTERALQMAFRAHLGMTPVELIRRLRMERIHKELQLGVQGDGVLEVATRWGMTNRSTLAQHYREQFAETPSATLRGR